MKKFNLLIIEDERELQSTYHGNAKEIFNRVLVASTCREARDIFNNNQIDCLLVDNKLPDGLGISLVKELNKEDNNFPIIMITAYADKDLAIESLNSGVFHFLEKPVKRKQLIEILQKCYCFLTKKHNIQEIENTYFLTEATISLLKENYEITNREIEIISLALLNYKNIDIAKKLFISPGTVKRHIHNILDKMDVTSKEGFHKIIQELSTSKSN